MAMMYFHSQPSGEYDETDDTGMYPVHQKDWPSGCTHAAKPFIVEHHIFLAEAPFFPKRGNQLWCTSKQQAKRQFKTGDVIHIQQGNTQPFFWSGLCQPTPPEHPATAGEGVEIHSVR